MWILPPKLKELYLSAQECEDLNVDSKELASLAEHSLMWKSKPSSLKTWLTRWKTVYWMRRLYGRILKPSLGKIFEERYTASLADIHVNRLVLPEGEEEQMTQDTSFPISQEESRLSDPDGASLRTSPDTLILDTKKSEESYKDLVTRLKKEYSQRKKLAHLTREKDSLSSQWKTPTTQEVEHPNMELTESGRRKTKDGKDSHSIGLADQTRLWLTPTASEQEQDLEKFQKRMEKYPTNGTTMPSLSNPVKMWATPVATDSDRTTNAGGAELVNPYGYGLQGRGAETSPQDDTGGREIEDGHRGSCGDVWPARPGQPQYDWEEPRLKSKLGFTVNGYNYREDLLRMAGNGVVEQTAEKAFLTLWGEL